MLTSWSWLSLKFLHRYGMALVLVCAATVCRFIFLAKLGDQAPFVTFFPAMIFAALYGGLGPGLMATFLSAVLADYLLLEPQGILQLRDSSNIASLAFFLVSGSMISVLVNTMQRARERSRQAEIQASLADQRLQVAQAAQHHAEVTDGINRILNAAIANHSERELGHICLDVAEKVTQSRCGFIGEISAAGKMDTIAISDPGWDVCRVKDAMGHDKNAPRNHPLRGLYGEVLLEGKAFLTNDPVNHPSSIGTPPGHPEIHSFLGVPLIHNDKTIGLVAMANREGGYNQEQLE
ncbi:MAG: DUF4118 domain-containing protein, partial [Phycisphaerales bacterium]|nr:DUF4118 domain-containing protein [Phycisphaerales bacterium]